MAGLNIDLGERSAAAVALTLRLERDRLKRELENVERAIDQLEKIDQLPQVEVTKEGNARHGETEKAVQRYMLDVAGPWGADLEAVVKALGTSRTTTYRALKALESKGAIYQMACGGWRSSHYKNNPPE